MKKKLTVQVAQVKQEASEILGKEASIKYYLIIGDKPNQLVINVGKNTHDVVRELVDGEEVTKMKGEKIN